MPTSFLSLYKFKSKKVVFAKGNAHLKVIYCRQNIDILLSKSNQILELTCHYLVTIKLSSKFNEKN